MVREGPEVQYGQENILATPHPFLQKIGDVLSSVSISIGDILGKKSPPHSVATPAMNDQDCSSEEGKLISVQRCAAGIYFLLSRNA